MGGTKGKSGRVSTPEQRQARRAAASLGGRAKAGRSGPDDARRDADGDGPPEITGNVFPVSSWIDYKDHLACELQKRKIATAEVELAKAQDDRDVARGRLLTREQVEARDAARDELVLGRLSELTEASVRLHPLEAQAEARRQLGIVLAEFRRSVAAALKSLGK